jgi:hypothetical protein
MAASFASGECPCRSAIIARQAGPAQPSAKSRNIPASRWKRHLEHCSGIDEKGLGMSAIVGDVILLYATVNIAALIFFVMRGMARR